MAMTAKKVLLVGDGGDADALAREAGGRFEVVAQIRDLPFRIGGLRRHLGYFALAWQAIWRQVDGVLVWQQFVGLYLLLLYTLMPWRARPLLLYYVIYKPAGNRLLDRIKFRVMRAMTYARPCAVVYFMSRDDRLYAVTPVEKRRLIADHPFHSPYIEAHIGMSDTDYFFAGGASNRDFAVFRTLAEQMPEVRFKVACLASQAEAIAPLPNLEVRTDVSPQVFEDMVLHSKAVILPLANPGVVSGQLVCLAAMQAGKPIYMTRNSFIAEWIDPDMTSDFLAFFERTEDLLVQLRGHTDPVLETRGKAARAFYLTHHDPRAVYRVFADELQHILA